MQSKVMMNPEELLEQLKVGAKSARTVRSLDIIHKICKEQRDRGSIDFSYEMIGGLSEKMGGPKAQPIRNATGAAYRALIDAWADSVASRAGKSSVTRQQSLADDVIALTDDPVLRILVQSYISENRKLKNENQILKVAAREMIVIDMSGKKQTATSANATASPSSLLHEQELKALNDAISEETMRKQGWAVNEYTGAVNKGPLLVFSPGFVSAIRKIMSVSEQ